jgi:hypothetical protein
MSGSAGTGNNRFCLVSSTVRGPGVVDPATLYLQIRTGINPTQPATLTLKLDAARNLLSQEPQVRGRAAGRIQGPDASRYLLHTALGLRSQATRSRRAGPHAGHPRAGNQLRPERPERLRGGPGAAAAAAPAACEVAAYHIVQEALTNVSCHARAHACRVMLSIGDELESQILGDGIGLPEDPRASVGLSSMRERLPASRERP